MASKTDHGALSTLLHAVFPAHHNVLRRPFSRPLAGAGGWSVVEVGGARVELG